MILEEVRRPLFILRIPNLVGNQLLVYGLRFLAYLTSFFVRIAIFFFNDDSFWSLQFPHDGCCRRLRMRVPPRFTDWATSYFPCRRWMGEIYRVLSFISSMALTSSSVGIIPRIPEEVRTFLPSIGTTRPFTTV